MIKKSTIVFMALFILISGCNTSYNGDANSLRLQQNGTNLLLNETIEKNQTQTQLQNINYSCTSTDDCKWIVTNCCSDEKRNWVCANKQKTALNCVAGTDYCKERLVSIPFEPCQCINNKCEAKLEFGCLIMEDAPAEYGTAVQLDSISNRTLKLKLIIQDSCHQLTPEYIFTDKNISVILKSTTGGCISLYTSSTKYNLICKIPPDLGVVNLNVYELSSWQHNPTQPNKTTYIGALRINISSQSANDLLPYLEVRREIINTENKSVITILEKNFTIELESVDGFSNPNTARLRINNFPYSVIMGKEYNISGQRIYVKDIFAYTQPAGSGGILLLFNNTGPVPD